MNIRKKLIFLFVSIVALIFVGSSVSIYFFSADYREDDFYRRMENKARITARLLIEVDEVTEELLRRIEEDNPISLSNEKIIIYDFQNSVLYSSDDEGQIVVDADLLDRIRVDGSVRFTQDEFEALGFLYSDRFDRVVVIVAATDIYGLNKLKNLRAILLIVFAAGVIIIFISAAFYVGKALEPIKKVIREVDDISAGSLHRRVDEGNGNDEISNLARTFNNMLARLETAFVAQKQFIANASHELRNPLTAMLGQIDVTLISKRDATEYELVLSSLKEDIVNLKNVSNRLLLLAQASVEDTNRRMTPQRADQLLWEAKAELDKLQLKYNIVIEMDPGIADDDRLMVLADEQLLKGAFVNVMDNACKYSANRRVHIRVQPHGNVIRLQFTDDGIGIPPEDLPHIFEPFYRGRNVNTVKGTGIGLSLVSRIVKAHGGAMEVTSRPEHGTSVLIVLPITNIQA